MPVTYKIEGRQVLHGQVTAQGLPGAAMAGMAAALLTPQTVTLRNVPHLPALDRLLTELQPLGVAADWTHHHEMSLRAAEVMPFPLLTANQLLSRLPLVIVALVVRCGVCRLELHSQEQQNLMQCLELVRRFGGLVEVEEGLLRLAFPHRYGCQVDVTTMDIQASLSAMLLAALSEGQTEIIGLPHDPQVVALQSLLQAMGATIWLEGERWLCTGVTQLSGANVVLPCDPVEVGLFAIAALQTGGEVTIKGVPATTVTGFVSKMRQMGAGYRVSQNELHFWQPPNQAWRGVSIEAQPYPGIPVHWVPMLLPFLVQVQGEAEVITAGFDLQSAASLLRSLGAEFYFGQQSIKIFGPVRLAAGKMQVTNQSDGLAALIAALAASGTSEISGMELIEGQFEHLSDRLQKLGAKVIRIER